MNDYLHLFSPKYGAQPYMDFAAGLRADQPPPKKMARAMSTPRLFSFYERDMEKWAAKIKSPDKRSRGPLRVIDFHPRGNPVAVIFCD